MLRDALSDDYINGYEFQKPNYLMAAPYCPLVSPVSIAIKSPDFMHSLNCFFFSA